MTARENIRGSCYSFGDGCPILNVFLMTRFKDMTLSSWDPKRYLVRLLTRLGLLMTHTGDVMMGAIASQITSLTFVYSIGASHPSSLRPLFYRVLKQNHMVVAYFPWYFTRRPAWKPRPRRGSGFHPGSPSEVSWKICNKKCGFVFIPRLYP